MSIELKRLLYHHICSEFEKAYNEIDQSLSRYSDLLLKVDNLGLWSITVAVQGEDVRDPTLKDFELLEKSGILEGKVKFTHRNIEKIFALTNTGKELVSKIKEEKLDN